MVLLFTFVHFSLLKIFFRKGEKIKNDSRYNFVLWFLSNECSKFLLRLDGWFHWWCQEDSHSGINLILNQDLKGHIRDDVINRKQHRIFLSNSKYLLHMDKLNLFVSTQKNKTFYNILAGILLADVFGMPKVVHFTANSWKWLCVCCNQLHR